MTGLTENQKKCLKDLPMNKTVRAYGENAATLKALARRGCVQLFIEENVSVEAKEDKEGLLLVIINRLTMIENDEFYSSATCVKKIRESVKKTKPVSLSRTAQMSLSIQELTAKVEKLTTALQVK